MSTLSETPSIGAVKTALGESTNSLIGLCTSENINVWSKWKPVRSNLIPMTFTELKRLNYGISILSSNTPANLLTLVQNAGGVGYTYTRPTGASSSPYRLGDFRYYNKDAGFPIYSHYEDGDTEKIANVSTTYTVTLDGIETIDGGEDGSVNSQTAGISRASIYPNGNSLNRGCLLKYGSIVVWSVGTVPYGLTQWQQLKGKVCTCLEFLTNVESGQNHVNHTMNANDRFYAMPIGLCEITLLNQTPAGSKDAYCTGRVELASNKASVSYRIAFSSVGEVYAGGTLLNVYVGLYSDVDCRNAIYGPTKIADSISLGVEETSRYYTGLCTNSLHSESVYLGVSWNGTVKWKTQPMATVDPTA